MPDSRPRIHVNVPLRMLLDTHLDLVLRHGINPEIGLNAATLDRVSPETVRPVAERLREAGLTVSLHAPFMDIRPGAVDPLIRRATRRRFEQTLAMVEVLAPRTVVAHADYDDRRDWYNRDRWLENSRQMFTWLGGAVAAAGSRLMLENVYEERPEYLVPLLEGLAVDRVGGCLDCGHATVFGSGGLAVWLEVLGPWLGQFHLHDNRGERDDHLALGDGCIDFDPVRRLLAARRDDPPLITLEPRREADLWTDLKVMATWFDA